VARAEEASAASASPPTTSRLNSLIRRAPQLFLPSRLYLGQDNTLTLRGTPGSEVALYFSAEADGFTLPGGVALRVGEEHQTMQGTIGANGILTLTLPLPKDEALEGRVLFLDAVSWQKADQSDVLRFEQLDATGRRTLENGVPIVKPADTARGPLLMPGMPGMSTDMLRQVTSFSDVMGDERKQQLIDQGKLDRNTLIDRNPFVVRPGLRNNTP
jgi:hypothetical protein